MRELFQIATTLLQNATFITKCDVYYKLRQHKNKQCEIIEAAVKIVLTVEIAT